MNVEFAVIARIRTPYGEKFGVPRQSGLARSEGTIVFEPAYRSADAVRGLAGFSHLWLLWLFDRTAAQGWSPTVRPPRLGGNVRMGVFATRSPFRPNPIGLSCVELTAVEETAEGPVLHVTGADLVDGTPILDIKPYLPYCDSHPDARPGWTAEADSARLKVDFPAALLSKVPEQDRPGLTDALTCDPRPRYQDDPARVYGLRYGERNVRFTVEGSTLHVVEISDS